MTNANNIGALKDEQLESVAGGFAPEPSDPGSPGSPTKSWSKATLIPPELGGGAVGCPNPGCNQKAMEWEGNSDITLSTGKTEFCYRFHCTNAGCQAHYAKSVGSGKWYIEN